MPRKSAEHEAECLACLLRPKLLYSRGISAVRDFTRDESSPGDDSKIASQIQSDYSRAHISFVSTQLLQMNVAAASQPVA